jgi:hypothetical protein
MKTLQSWNLRGHFRGVEYTIHWHRGIDRFVTTLAGKPLGDFYSRAAAMEEIEKVTRAPQDHDPA